MCKTILARTSLDITFINILAAMPPRVTQYSTSGQLPIHKCSVALLTTCLAFPYNRATKKGDYFAGIRTASIASPSGAANVAWVELAHVQGALGQTVFRVETAGGQPPSNVSKLLSIYRITIKVSTCSQCSKAGEVITSEYAAYYWIFR